MSIGVLGIPAVAGDSAIAFPFGKLAALGPFAAVHTRAAGNRVVVFWDNPKQAAMAFIARSGGRDLLFEVVGGRLQDRETGSTWTVEGSAIDGALAGQRLVPVPEAFVAFWFAWAAFHTSTRIAL
jgi:hypothetical protein